MGELHDRMKGECLMRGYSPRTYNAYLSQLSKAGQTLLAISGGHG